MVEDILKANGGICSKESDWTPYAVEVGLLITGQNPASSEFVAKLLLEKLKQKLCMLINIIMTLKNIINIYCIR